VADRDLDLRVTVMGGVHPSSMLPFARESTVPSPVLSFCWRHWALFSMEWVWSRLGRTVGTWSLWQPLSGRSYSIVCQSCSLGNIAAG